MLARKFRLPASIVVKSSPIFSDSSVVIKAQKNTLPYSRFGFVVGKSIDKRATERNRIKRMTRSCIEEKWLGLLGYDVLFVLRPSSKLLVRADMQGKIDTALEKLS